MTYLFIVCAVLGGTVLICQFVMTILGLGDDGGDGDIGDIADDISGESSTHYDSTWLFSVISFRTMVAAVTFFGLAGWAALEGGQPTGTALVIGLGCGAAAMFGVHYLMQAIYKLNADGSQRIERAVGKRCTVYLPIPPERTGAGKVQVRLQGRIVEYQAMTAEHEILPTGARVVIVGVLTPSTVDVELVPEVVEAMGEE